MATVPTGYVFWDVSAKKLYPAGSTFPALGNGDYLVPATSTYDGYYHQYIYYTSYSQDYVSFTNGWYGQIQSQYATRAPFKLPFKTINGKPVRAFSYTNTTVDHVPLLKDHTNLYYVWFQGCTSLTRCGSNPGDDPLPVSLKSFRSLFNGCTSLTNVYTNMSKYTSVTTAAYMFKECKNIISIPILPNTILDMRYCFYNCTRITSVPNIPTAVTDMGWAFYNCSNLQTIPTISSKASLWQTFYNCTKLTGVIRLMNGASNHGETFKGTAKNILVLSKVPTYFGSYSNVYYGFRPEIQSFKLIRWDRDLNKEDPYGESCLLIISYNARIMSSFSASLNTPDVNYFLNGVKTPINTTWYIDQARTLELTNNNQLLASGSLYALIDIQDGMDDFETSLTSVYNDSAFGVLRDTSNIQTAALTSKIFIMDVNPLGKGVGLLTAVDDDFEGLKLTPNARIDLDGNFYSNEARLLAAIEGAVIVGSVTWDYKKYVDGTLEMWGKAITTLAISTASGNIYTTASDYDIAMPTFVDTVDFISAELSGAGWADVTSFNTPPKLRLYAPTSYGSAERALRYYFKGTWK